jgi:hypothetical protein
VDKITYVEKADILDALETFLDTNPDVTSSPERARKVQLASIRRPPEGVENVLAIHTCKYSYVKRHIQVADDEEYFGVVVMLTFSVLYCRRSQSHPRISSNARFLGISTCLSRLKSKTRSSSAHLSPW